MLFNKFNIEFEYLNLLAITLLLFFVSFVIIYTLNHKILSELDKLKYLYKSKIENETASETEDLIQDEIRIEYFEITYANKYLVEED